MTMNSTLLALSYRNAISQEDAIVARMPNVFGEVLYFTDAGARAAYADHVLRGDYSVTGDQKVQIDGELVSVPWGQLPL